MINPIPAIKAKLSTKLGEIVLNSLPEQARKRLVLEGAISTAVAEILEAIQEDLDPPGRYRVSAAKATEYALSAQIDYEAREAVKRWLKEHPEEQKAVQDIMDQFAARFPAIKDNPEFQARLGNTFLHAFQSGWY